MSLSWHCARVDAMCVIVVEAVQWVIASVTLANPVITVGHVSAVGEFTTTTNQLSQNMCIVSAPHRSLRPEKTQVPEEWVTRQAEGNILYSDMEVPRHLMPNYGNGYMATQVSN